MGRLKILLVIIEVLILLITFGSVAMGYSQEQKMDVVFHDEM
ncbi:MAG: hypothetical protein ACLU4J_11730 [Butyricimonas paravirosa]